MNWIEILGYAASVLVALSLTMSSIVRLRWLNLAGAAMFSSYGFLIAAVPVAAVNGFIVLANLYYLFNIYTRSDRFHMVDAIPEDPLIRYWLDENRSEIDHFFPDFDLQRLENPVCSLLLRNNNPVGLLVGEQAEQTFRIALDYVFPPYRDYRTGQYLYRESGYFSQHKVTRVTTYSRSDKHRDYLERMGFRPIPDSQDGFEYLVKG